MVVPDALPILLDLSEVLRKGRPAAADARSCPPGHKPDQRLRRVHPPARRVIWKAKETDERLLLVAAWREADYFTAAERAALALAESVTRLSDRQDPVPDDVWDRRRGTTGQELGALVISIGLVTSGTGSTSPPGRCQARTGAERYPPGTSIVGQGSFLALVVVFNATTVVS